MTTHRAIQALGDLLVAVDAGDQKTIRRVIDEETQQGRGLHLILNSLTLARNLGRKQFGDDYGYKMASELIRMSDKHASRNGG